MYACLHVCMYACVHACMHACVYACCIHACMHVCTHVCLYVSQPRKCKRITYGCTRTQILWNTERVGEQNHFDRRKADRVEGGPACIYQCHYVRASVLQRVGTYECVHLWSFMLCLYVSVYICSSSAMYLLCVSTCDFSAFQAIPRSDPLSGAPSEPPTLSINHSIYLSVCLSVYLSIKFYQSIYILTTNGHYWKKMGCIMYNVYNLEQWGM